MKKFLLISTLTLLMLSLALPIAAQEEEEVVWAKDILETTFYGAFSSPSGELKTWKDSLGPKGDLGYGFEVGYFATYSLVVGFGFTYYQFDIDNNVNDIAAEGLTHRLYSPTLYAKYYPQLESNFSPYVKASIGLDFPKFTTYAVSDQIGNRYRQLSYDPALSLGASLGLFYFVHDYGGLYLEADYHYGETIDVEAEYAQGGTYRFEEKISLINIRFGIRILVGADE